MGLRETIASAFSFLGTSSQKETRVAQYVIREHSLGRPLREILEDHYVANRLAPEQVNRLLERPEIVHALGEHTVAEARTTL